MSASDKKQQRKAAQAEAMTQRERRQAEEAKAAKQQKTIYTAIGAVCAAAAVALLVWNGSGRLHDNAAAMTIDGVEYSAADLQYYYSLARNQVYNTAASYIQQYGFNITGYDPSVDDGAQWYNEAEGQTWADYFREQAVENLKQTATLCAAAEKDEGYTATEAVQKSVEDQLASFDVPAARSGMTRSAYIKSAFGVSEKVLERNLTRDATASEYANHYWDGLSYEDSEIQAYYEENADTMDTYDYRLFTVSGTVPTTDADGNTVEVTDEQKEAAMAEAKEKAEEAMAEIKAASNKEKAFIAAAPKYGDEETYTEADSTLNAEVLGSRLYVSTDLDAWLKDSARKSGDVTVLETSTGYQVVLFLDRYLAQDPTVDVRHILVRADTTDSTSTNAQGVRVPTQEAMDAAKAEAEALLEEWKAGEMTAESFGALANEHSDDGGSNTKGGLYTCVYEGEMVPNFNDWIFDSARKAGDTGLVENNSDTGTYYGWHVVYYQGENVPYWKSTATNALKNASLEEYVNSLTGAATSETLDGMKYVGSASTATPTPTATPAESTTPEATTSPEA